MDIFGGREQRVDVGETRHSGVSIAERGTEIGRVLLPFVKCASKRRHIKSRRLRGSYYLARGGERVISRHRHPERATPPKMRGYPIYLTTSTVPKPKRPRGLIANRRLLSSLLPCTHYVPIMYNRYMYLLGFS